MTAREPATHARTSRGARPGIALAAVCVALLPVLLNTTAVNTALPEIGQQFGSSLSTLQWIVSIYMLVSATAIVAGGVLSDLYGRRRLFLVVGVGCFTLASLLIALAGNDVMVVLGRGIQGLGAAFIVPGTLSILTVAFPPERRAAAFGVWGAAAGLGFALGPLVGGVLTDTLGWQFVWWLNLPLMAVVVVLTLMGVQETRGRSRRLDVRGLSILAVGLLLLVLALDQGSDWGWTSGATLGALGGAFALLAVFVVVERRSKEPAVDFSDFRNRSFLGSNLGTMLSTFVLIAALFIMNLYLQNPLLLDSSAIGAGAALLPMSLLLFSLSLVVARITGRFGVRWTLGAGFAAQAVALWMLSDVHASATYGALWPPLSLFGIGLGLTFAPVSGVGVSALPEDKAGEASGVINMSRYVGGAVGVAVIASVTAGVAASRLGDLTAEAGHPAVRAKLEVALAGAPATEASLLSGLPRGARTTFTGAAREASLAGFSAGLRATAGVALLTAILWVVLVSTHRTRVHLHHFR